MDNIYSKVRSLKTPAIIYFVVALFFVIGHFFEGVYCYARSNKCNINIEETFLETFFLVIFTFIWTWVINTLYSRGYHKTSWFILIFFPAFFI
jgi:hypothetical protein